MTTPDAIMPCAPHARSWSNDPRRHPLSRAPRRRRRRFRPLYPKQARHAQTAPLQARPSQEGQSNPKPRPCAATRKAGKEQARPRVQWPTYWALAKACLRYQPSLLVIRPISRRTPRPHRRCCQHLEGSGLIHTVTYRTPHMIQQENEPNHAAPLRGAPNHLRYIPMARGFVYLCAVVDWFSRRVLSWRLSITMEAAFCIEAVEEALARHGKPDIFNTDKGSSLPPSTSQPY